MQTDNIAAVVNGRKNSNLGDVLGGMLKEATDVSGLTHSASPLSLEIDALVAAGFGDYLRPCPPPGTAVWVFEGERLVEKKTDGKLPAKLSDGRWIGFKGWPQPRSVTPEDLQSWRTWPEAGLCLVTGDVVAIDIDIKVDPSDTSPAAARARALVDTLRRIVAEEVGRPTDELPVRTRSNSSSLVILLRASAPFRKTKLSFGDGLGVELLASGQQVVIAGLHKTGAMQSSTLARYRVQTLPELSEAVFSTMWARFREAITQAGYQFATACRATRATSQSHKSKSEEAFVWREVVRRRADWIPDVLPCSLQMPKGEWRFSSLELDRDLEEDLVVYPDGIYDFGTERPHDPLSLIREFGSIDDEGSITFGGSPEYGPRDNEPYSVVGEGGSIVERPSDEQAAAWLYRVLGRPEDAPREHPTVHDFARVLGLDWACLEREVLLGKFDQLDKLTPPDQWDSRTITMNARRLPAMRAAGPVEFEGYCDTWDRNFAATPDDIRVLIESEIERVRNTAPNQAAGNEPDQMPAAFFGDDATRSVGSASWGGAIARCNIPVITGVIDPRSIPVREWLVEPRLPIGDVAQLVGEPGINKSTFTLRDALAIAADRPDILTGLNKHGQPISPERLHTSGAVIVYNAEDRFEEMKRRLAAAQAYYGIANSDINPIALWSGVDQPTLTLMKREGGRGALQAAPGLQMLEAVIGQLKAVLVVLDPQLSLVAGGQENDNDDADALFQELARLAARNQCCVMVVHHTSKQSRQAAGDMAAGRGGFAAVGKVRSSATVVHVTGEGPGEKEWGVTRQDRLVRLDYAKISHARKPTVPLVFRQSSVPVGNGVNGTPGMTPDSAQALFTVSPREALRIAGDQAPLLDIVDITTLGKDTKRPRDDARARQIAEFADSLMGGTDETPLADIWSALGVKMREANLMQAKSPQDVRGHIVASLSEPVVVDGQSGPVALQVVKRPIEGKRGGKIPWWIVRTSYPTGEAETVVEATE